MTVHVCVHVCVRVRVLCPFVLFGNVSLMLMLLVVVGVFLECRSMVLVICEYVLGGSRRGVICFVFVVGMWRRGVEGGYRVNDLGEGLYSFLG